MIVMKQVIKEEITKVAVVLLIKETTGVGTQTILWKSLG